VRVTYQLGDRLWPVRASNQVSPRSDLRVSTAEVVGGTSCFSNRCIPRSSPQQLAERNADERNIARAASLNLCEEFAAALGPRHAR